MDYVLAILIGIAVFGFIGILVCEYMLHKNNKVRNFRKQLIEDIDKAAAEDIDNGRDWRWRFDEFDKVSYNEMMSLRNIFKSPESFYPDRSFTK